MRDDPESDPRGRGNRLAWTREAQSACVERRGLEWPADPGLVDDVPRGHVLRHRDVGKSEIPHGPVAERNRHQRGTVPAAAERDGQHGPAAGKRAETEE